MEENKDIKISLSTFFLIFAIIIIVVMSYFLYRFYNEKIDATEESEKLSQQINQLEKKVNDLNQDSKNETTPNNKMSIELAYGILNKYKTEKLPDAKWYITDVSLVAHGDNNTYLVAYKEENLDGYDEEVSTIVEYKNNKWTTDLPGSSGFSDEEMDKYNFVYYD